MKQSQLEELLSEHNADQELTDSLVLFFNKIQGAQGIDHSLEADKTEIVKGRSDPDQKSTIVPVSNESSEPKIREKSYELIQLLGKGGMGEIWRVKDVALNRTLAMKILHEEVEGLSNKEMDTRRFIEEAHVCAQLQHPNIVPIHELGTLPDGRIYFTMKEIKGRTLQDVINVVHEVSTGGQWKTSSCGWNLFRLMDAFHQVCQAVSYAHSKGVLHRDLKPKNIMMGQYGEVLVVDWGIAKIMNECDTQDGGTAIIKPSDLPSTRMHTRYGSIIGTPAFMSPEQAKGVSSQHDQRTDIYALGVILHVALTGRGPYAGKNVEEILKQIVSDSPALLRRNLKPTELDDLSDSKRVASNVDLPLPDILIEACEKAMAKDPQDRFAKVDELDQLISQWLDGSRRQQQAQDLLARARQLKRQKLNLQVQLKVLRKEAEEGLSAIQAWESEEKKGPWWAKAQEAEDKQDEVWRLHAEYEQMLLTALNYSPDLLEAREAIIEHYAEAHRNAEKSFNKRTAQRQALRLKRHVLELPHGHKSRPQQFAYLKGTGAVSIWLSVDNVDITLEQYVPHHKRLVAKTIAKLDADELVKYPLEMGSYRLRLRKEGHHEVLYPVYIARGEHWDCRDAAGIQHPIHLPKLGELGPQDCFVSAGWFWMGGDLEEANMLPRKRVWLDDFVMSKHPVTNMQYVSFLNDLVKSGRMKDALKWVPRGRSGIDGVLGKMLFRQKSDGFFDLCEASSGTVWHPKWPVGMVDYDSVVAYTSWFSNRSRHTWSLPEEQYWEKAARGVDGRIYPWGESFDPSYCCVHESHVDTTSPVDIDSISIDVSVYGVVGMAGNFHDMTVSGWRRSPYHPEEEGIATIRGGSLFSNGVRARIPARTFIEKANRSGGVGFRLWRPYSRR